MALSMFDASQSSKQATLARQEKAKADGWGGAMSGDSVKKMTAEQQDKFQNSKFMQQTQQIDEEVKRLMQEKSAELMRTDCTWLPQDSDFTAPKAFKYDKFISYYGVLGCPDMCTQADIKAAYKRLSLVYHPDKTAGMGDKEKEDYAMIFIQLKNAYSTLLDNPTRRQYDWDRCREFVMCEICGGKMKHRDQFWGYEVNTEKIQASMEKELAPGVDVDLPTECALEKFVYGGQKTIWRDRRVRIKGEFETRHKPYHIDIAQGQEEPIVKKFVRKGDDHLDRLSDTLIFTLTSRTHEYVERRDPDLQVKKKLSLPDDVENEPYLTFEAPSVYGRHVVVWGRNPFFHNTKEGKKLCFAVHGQGIRGDGCLRFEAVPSEGLMYVEGLKKHNVWEVVGGADKGGILVREGRETTAPKCADRLATGAYVKELELDGERLHYEKLSDTGPEYGWVAIKLPGKDLVVPQPGLVCYEVIGGKELGGIIVRKGKDRSSPQVGRLTTGSLVRQLAVDGDCLQYELIKNKGKGPQTGFVMISGEEEKKPDFGGPKVVSIDPSFSSMPMALKRRTQRRNEAGQVCEIELSSMAWPCGLYTNPGCSIQFFSNLGQQSRVPTGKVKPTAMFACVIESMACSSKDRKGDWDWFKGSFVPLFKQFAFTTLLPIARKILPKSLPSSPVFPESEYGQKSDSERPVPWAHLAERAVAFGDIWLAAVLFSHALEEMKDEGFEKAAMLSKRASCYATLGQGDASLADAKAATELTPKWNQPWSQVGFAYTLLEASAETLQGSIDAYAQAVELEPSFGDVEALGAAVGKLAWAGDTKPWSEEKERGNTAMASGEFSKAVAAYTSALSRVPPDANAADNYCLLFCNRSLAFAQMKRWDSAISDAEKAVGTKGDSAKAHARLGVALLGSGQCEKAYVEFSVAVQKDGDLVLAREGMNSCIVESTRMCSAPARARKNRFGMDMWRPLGSTRVFGMADIHFDLRINEEWVHNIDGLAFQDDVLVIAGDMADTFHQICRGLTMLKSKFRRVFYTPGCHEMWITIPEMNTYQDSFQKLYAIMEACDAIGIDIMPAPVCQDVYVVPLYSWYNCIFDEKDPFPDANVDQNPFCKWPIDKEEQVWKFFCTMNEEHLKLPYHGTVITASHILPRRDLPYWTHIYHQAKFIGCTDLEDQLRSINSSCHVFGRSHRRFGRQIDGVWYVNMPLGKEDERMEDFPPLMLVWDRDHVCAKEWGINNVQIENSTLSILEKTHYGKK